MDAARFTQKSQQALVSARDAAVGANHQTVEPAHLLVALLEQPDTVALPLLARLGRQSRHPSPGGRPAGRFPAEGLRRDRDRLLARHDPGVGGRPIGDGLRRRQLHVGGAPTAGHGRFQDRRRRTPAFLGCHP